MSASRLPTRLDDWRLMARTARLVLGIPTYGVGALVAGLGILTLVVATLNLTLVNDLVVGGSLSLADRVSILLELYPFIGTSFGPLQGLLLVLVAALAGVDLVLVTYHFRRHGFDLDAGGTGAAGILLGALGAGCAACGSAILLGVLSLFGVSVSLLFLPLEGLEFALLAAGALLLSIHWLADGMRGGEIDGCPVEL